MEHFFMFISPLNIFFGEVSVKILCPLFVELYVLLLVSHERFKQILGASPQIQEIPCTCCRFDSKPPH